MLSFVQLQRRIPAVASPTEQLYEQMTSFPAFTKRNNIQNANTYLLNILARTCTYVFGWPNGVSTAPFGSP